MPTLEATLTFATSFATFIFGGMGLIYLFLRWIEILAAHDRYEDEREQRELRKKRAQEGPR